MSEPIFHTVITNPVGSRQDAHHKQPPDPGKPSLVQRPCMYLTCFVKFLPVIFISLIVCWSYYAYFVAVILTIMTNISEQVICATIFHLITILFVWSYYMIVFTPAGTVPSHWRLSSERVESLASAKSEEEWKSVLSEVRVELGCVVQQRSVQNAVRYCEKCLCIKPDRSHHCSVCETCTLKMDHHCPWVNNCVGFANYKFFLLFLGYALSYCIFIAATSARHFLRIWILKEEDSDTAEDENHIENHAEKYHLLFVFFISILFCLSISSLFCYHIWLVLHNRTTLEQFRAPMFSNNVSDPSGWSLGRRNNVEEVFGSSVFSWLLPIKTTLGDGLSFPVKHPLGDLPNHERGAQHNALSVANASIIHETPSRTLINPSIGPKGKISVTETSNSLVRIDNNGCTKTIMLGQPDDDDQTMQA